MRDHIADHRDLDIRDLRPDMIKGGSGIKYDSFIIIRLNEIAKKILK